MIKIVDIFKLCSFQHQNLSLPSKFDDQKKYRNSVKIMLFNILLPLVLKYHGSDKSRDAFSLTLGFD
jgi:hypothetical protein